MKTVLQYFVEFLLLSVVSFASHFLFSFGGAQIFSILRFALPFTQRLKRENNARFSKRIYFVFFFIISFWLVVFAVVSCLVFFYTSLAFGLLVGAVLGLHHAWKVSAYDSTKECDYFSVFGRYILGYNEQQSAPVKRSKALTVAFCIALAAAVIGWYGCYYWYEQNDMCLLVVEGLSAMADDYEEEISQTEDYYKGEIVKVKTEYESKINNLELSIKEKEQTISLYENCVAFINMDEPDMRDAFFYHTINCPLLKGNYLVASISEAEQYNFTSCPHCHKNTY